MRNLEARYYVDPSLHERERSTIFHRAWNYVGPAAKVEGAGSYLAADIAGAGVVAVRGADGELRAFRNVCRHRGASLLPAGDGLCNTLRCPYHHWVFDHHGALIAAPHFGDDPTFRLEDWPLESVHVDQWRGLLFVAIDPVESLLEQLGGLPDELADEPIERYTATDSARIEFDANWKIYTDNFVEGYHIPGIHPAFFDAIDFRRFETTVHRNYIRMTAPPRPGLFYKGLWLWMWPNWTLSLFEGGINTSRINPLAVDRTEQRYDFWFEDASESAAEFRAGTVRSNVAVVHEDVSVCGDIHRNFAAGTYTPGPLSPRHEQAVGYYQQRVAAAVG